MRPFTFLAGIQKVVNGAGLAADARRAEAMGFAALVVPDHLIEQLSPIPALATIAAATDSLRIAAFVHNNDLRHPAVLAQDLASLDVLSDGRLDVAIGDASGAFTTTIDAGPGRGGAYTLVATSGPSTATVDVVAVETAGGDGPIQTPPATSTASQPGSGVGAAGLPTWPVVVIVLAAILGGGWSLRRVRQPAS